MFIDIRMSCKLTGKVQMNMAASFDMQQLSPSMPGNRPLGQANTWCDSSFILFGSILLPSMRFRFTHWSKPLNPAATHEAKGFGCAVFFAGKKHVYYIYIYTITCSKSEEGVFQVWWSLCSACQGRAMQKCPRQQAQLQKTPRQWPRLLDCSSSMGNVLFWEFGVWIS